MELNIPALIGGSIVALIGSILFLIGKGVPVLQFILDHYQKLQERKSRLTITASQGLYAHQPGTIYSLIRIHLRNTGGKPIHVTKLLIDLQLAPEPKKPSYLRQQLARRQARRLARERSEEKLGLPDIPVPEDMTEIPTAQAIATRIEGGKPKAYIILTSTPPKLDPGGQPASLLERLPTPEDRLLQLAIQHLLQERKANKLTYLSATVIAYDGNLKKHKSKPFIVLL